MSVYAAAPAAAAGRYNKSQQGDNIVAIPTHNPPALSQKKRDGAAFPGFGYSCVFCGGKFRKLLNRCYAVMNRSERV